MTKVLPCFENKHDERNSRTQSLHQLSHLSFITPHIYFHLALFFVLPLVNNLFMSFPNFTNLIPSPNLSFLLISFLLLSSTFFTPLLFLFSFLLFLFSSHPFSSFHISSLISLHFTSPHLSSHLFPSLFSSPRLYGDHATEILDLLRKNPAGTIPVVLKRLKQKDAEWRRARLDLQKLVRTYSPDCCVLLWSAVLYYTFLSKEILL